VHGREQQMRRWIGELGGIRMRPCSRSLILGLARAPFSMTLPRSDAIRAFFECAKSGGPQAQRQTKTVWHRACAGRSIITAAPKSPQLKGGLFDALTKAGGKGWERGCIPNLHYSKQREVKRKFGEIRGSAAVGAHKALGEANSRRHQG